MLVIHAVWLIGGRLALWAEDSASPVPSRRSGRALRERPHPYACGHPELADALGDLAAKAATGNALLALPTRAGVPVDSPELVRPVLADDDRGPVTLARWRVPTFEYDGDEALPALAAFAEDGAADRGAGPRHLVAGAGLRHLVELAGFATDLVRRGRLLPVVTEDPDAVPAARAAVWRPLLTGADAAWARALAMAFPPAGRAVVPLGRATEPAAGTTPSAELVADALDTLTDAAARLALEGVRLVDARRTTGVDAAARAWLRALTGRQRSFTADSAATSTLAAELRAWQRDAAGSSVRACLRLVEPAPESLLVVGDDSASAAPSVVGGELASDALSVVGDDSAPAAGGWWRVEFALQATDEPSAVVEAERIWASDGHVQGLADQLADPQETLLAELGRASRLWPELEAALRTATPTALDLDTNGAHRFLRDGAPVLHAAGFGVLLPSWWRKPGARLSARLQARSTRTAPGTVATASSLGLHSLVDYRWELALGDQPLSEAELIALARFKTPLVRLRGQWVELDPKRLAAGLKLLRSGGEMTVGDLLRLGLSAPDDPAALPVLAVTADGALGDLLAGRAERHLAPVDEPAEFRGTLRPYQKRGLAWLSFLESLGLGGILADDMGLGKCLSGAAPVFLNGTLVSAEQAWDRYAGPAISDGEGEWAEPIEALMTNALAGGPVTGEMVRARVHRLYRQRISEPVRRLRLDDGSEVVVTRRHKLLGVDGWTNDIRVGDRLGVPARLCWTGEPVDRELTIRLARQISEGRDSSGSIPDFIVSADDDTIRLFLREYFTAAGSVDPTSRIMEISSGSPVLIRQLSTMLRRLGVWLRVTVRHNQAAAGSAVLHPYQVGTIDGPSLRLFRQEVGFPATAEPAERAERADVHFATVVAVEDIDHTGWVYDFEVARHHNFVAGGMLCHNTVQLLALLAGDSPTTGPTLLVCPMSLVGNWQREAATFAPELRVHVHHGADRARGGTFAAAVREADLVVTTYSVAARDATALGKIEWHRIVVDEAQAIKNAATRQAEAVRSLPARHRVAVTGTPVENRLADLWSIMEFANPGLLGSAPTFKKRYAEPIERHGDDDAARRLRRITGPFVLRRLKTDSSIISDLPAKLEMEVLCNLTAEQASLYQAIVDDMLARIDSSAGIERRGLVLATMTKLKQVCNHPAQLLRDGSALPGRSGKLARLEEILDEVLAAGEKALLFTQYAEFGAMLRAHLSARTSREVLFLHGGVDKAGRDDLVTRFQAPGGPALFVLSLKAGGTGLTLTAANHVVHVDRWWNPAVEDQATDRAYRIGQRRAVQVRKFVCAGTVEEKISTMIGDKRALAGRIVGTGEQWLTELSTSELRQLFALEPGAVVE